MIPAKRRRSLAVDETGEPQPTVIAVVADIAAAITARLTPPTMRFVSWTAPCPCGYPDANWTTQRDVPDGTAVDCPACGEAADRRADLVHH